MDKYEDDLHNCTTERLAEMLNEQAASIEENLDAITLSMLESRQNEAALLREAANRLISLSQHRHDTFNSEQFNV